MWWVWVLLVAVLVGLFLLWWWLYRRSLREEQAARVVPASATRAASMAVPVEAGKVEPVAAPAQPDDLKIVEGIGPKIASLLQAAGIQTFSQLAAADVERLRGILAAAGLRALADPTTWPEQAQLAARGQWDQLKALQDKLKGGRRV